MTAQIEWDDLIDDEECFHRFKEGCCCGEHPACKDCGEVFGKPEGHGWMSCEGHDE